MMKYDQHIGSVTIFFSYVTLEMITKGQRGTRSHSNKSFLQCAGNGLVSFAAVRRLLIFLDIEWEDSQDLRRTSEIYTLTAL